MKKYDLVVIGGGPAGYSGAIRGAQLGGSVLLIEDRSLGGTCLNRGCIPTKAFYQGSKMLYDLKKSSEYGVFAKSIELEKDIDIDISQLLKFKNETVDNLVSGINSLIKSNEIDYINGMAEIGKDNLITVNNEEIVAKNIILANGSNPNKSIVGDEISNFCWTADEVVSGDKFWQSSNKRVVIIGGGVIGVEMATVFAMLGKEVELIELESKPLPPFDEEIKKRIGTYLKRLGIKVHTNSKVTEVFETDENSNYKYGLKVNKKKKDIEIMADDIILSVGREPNLNGIDPKLLGLKMERNYIVTNDKMQTNLDNVYAAGDIVSKGSQLAHAAMHQGIVAAENAMNYRDSYFDSKAIPACVFSHPQVGTVGLTEDECKRQGIPYKVGKFPFKANSKAMIMKEEGFAKIISHQETNEVLGIHILGPNASDLIQEGTIAVKYKLKDFQLAETIYSHPTLSETVWEAFLDLNDRPLHQASLKLKK
ncbi:dihydrolipoyl dehydrogenase [Natranaerofaba carboxydovora]|uniref:dihydrolipoyl dehydrogenase n=1 Tax=Natranaerofaba carboxydovora TaxID=2742683 RepID=UPI001F12CFFF|nr:dihydrolipoyl dehydrogenase [Natranaerofaba carboxydovora]UMZ74297.1 Dihydrolipoyl dehydrogenase [Natranaerofaba carboxydovora]